MFQKAARGAVESAKGGEAGLELAGVAVGCSILPPHDLGVSGLVNRVVVSSNGNRSTSTTSRARSETTSA
ncbi:hypothetical protein HYQ45_012502 [Verticillium longisporum]|uniref:Uncharacterized protein n=1 Tax=Verticillium longisporum TaxID=100787 RepID=A0A8I2ZEG0_VERLO|nr:hypothetical protein HYQ45_012502 [Verticillium longisporum]